MKPFLVVFAAAALGCGVAQAQLALARRGWNRRRADADAKPAHAKKAHKTSPGKLSPLATPGVESIVGAAAPAERPRRAIAFFGRGQDASDRQIHLARRGRLRSQPEVPHRYRFGDADRGQESGRSGRVGALFRRYPGLSAYFRRARRRGAGARADDRLRVSGRRLPGEPQRTLGARRRHAREGRQSHRESAQERGRLDKPNLAVHAGRETRRRARP